MYNTTGLSYLAKMRRTHKKMVSVEVRDLGLFAEEATRGVPYKRVLLKISQNSQENTSARVSFLIKLLAYGLQLY